MNTKPTPSPFIQDLLRISHPYSLSETLKGLIECADILLHKKDYDGHGWERLEYCYRHGKDILHLLETNEPKVKEAAAAPELLEALKEIVKENEFRGYGDSLDSIKAKEAIKKATL